jgi:hypothetical protein
MELRENLEWFGFSGFGMGGVRMVPSQAPRILRRWIILFKNQELVDLDRLA